MINDHTTSNSKFLEDFSIRAQLPMAFNPDDTSTAPAGATDLLVTLDMMLSGYESASIDIRKDVYNNDHGEYWVYIDVGPVWLPEPSRQIIERAIIDLGRYSVRETVARRQLDDEAAIFLLIRPGPTSHFDPLFNEAEMDLDPVV